MTQNEKNQIQSLLQDPRWRIVETLAQQISQKIALDESLDRETEWETLKEFLINRGQVKGIQRLLTEMWETLK